jgi:hypothetical protein
VDPRGIACLRNPTVPTVTPRSNRAISQRFSAAPKAGEKFIVPMSYATTEAVGMNILTMLLFHAPEMAQAHLATL